MPDYLRFGIPSFDRLLGYHGPSKDDDGPFGIRLPAKETISDATGICIIGPDGTGKSLFALHLASQYMTDCLGERQVDPTVALPRIYYISTDLNHDKAETTWRNLALNKPFSRDIPFGSIIYHDELKRVSPELYLERMTPQDTTRLVIPENEQNICFLDLAAETAGDDWGFVTRLLALLEQPKNAAPVQPQIASSKLRDNAPIKEPHDQKTKSESSTRSHPRHMIIIDAVEGFETYMGQLDAFGEATSRRARIAQIARLTAKKAHLLLIVEETKSGVRLPEEFVTDTVIRLRNLDFNKYQRRTLEIEKTRGQSHTRGQHFYTIRKGQGSTTGSQVNADDPKVKSPNADKPHQDYVQVFPSLSQLNRQIMHGAHSPKGDPPENKFAAFGIRYLDNMLGGTGFEAELNNVDGSDSRGLPYSTVTALIGDSLTEKHYLGRTFLERSFIALEKVLKVEWGKENKSKALNRRWTLKTDVKEIWQHAWTNCQTASDEKDPQMEHELEVAGRAVKQEVKRALRSESIRKRLGLGKNRIYQALQKCGFAVLFTSQDTHHEALAKTFRERWLRGGKKCPAELNRDYRKLIIEALVESRIICRRMEVHDISAPTLAHIFEQNIAMAQRLTFGHYDHERMPDIGERFKGSGRIRLVIDDFSAFRNTYPEVRENPLFLPYLLFYLGREGVTTLIVDTQSSSKPDLPITERYESALRESVHHRLYTWRVPFYGDNRIAITAIPPFSSQTSGAIRELRWEQKDEAVRSLEVNPHFELYAGLEDGKPQPIPLEVRFNASTPSFRNYLNAEELSYSELFTPHNREGRAGKPNVLLSYAQNSYQAIHNFALLQRGTRLDHTLIFQVDEFWTLRSPFHGRAGALRPQLEYLTTPTWIEIEGRDPVADPFSVFQPLPQSKPITDSHHDSGKRDDTLPENEEQKEDLQKGTKPKMYRRMDCYIKEYFKYMEDANKNRIELDRIPFAWDFAFLLCKGRAWEEARKETIDHLDNKTVYDIWSDLIKIDTEESSNPKAQNNLVTHTVSWFEFFAACKAVAEYQAHKTSTTIRAFDLPLRSLESFACLVLEIWASEIYDNILDSSKERFRRSLSIRSRPSPEGRTVSILEGLEKERKRNLTECISAKDKVGYSVELYKTWLLLTEVIDFSSLTMNPNTLSFDFKQELIGQSAVAAQHWYKSACDFMDSISPHDLEAEWMPVRLPGHFSVRGDWFLSVAGGSRSSRLADRALDLLSSKRANLIRLQEGVGLPVRKLFDDQGKNHLRTRLLAVHKDSITKTRYITNVTYKNLLKLSPEDEKDFYHLWRSNLEGYDRDLRIWHKWLNMMIHWWSSLRHKDASHWVDAFTVCRWIREFETAGDKAKRRSALKNLKDLNSWKGFHEWRNILIDDFQQAAIEPDSR